MTVTEEKPRQEAEAHDVEVEWVPVHRWDEMAAPITTDPDDLPSAIEADIEHIQRLKTRMHGGSMLDTEYRQAIEILDNALENRRRQLATLILYMHRSDNVGTGL